MWQRLPDADSSSFVCSCLTIHQTISDQHPQQSICANHQPKQPIGRGPIRVAPKAKRSRRPQNVFMDDHGFPDQPTSLTSFFTTIKVAMFYANKTIQTRLSTTLVPNSTTSLTKFVMGNYLARRSKLATCPGELQADSQH